MIICVHEDRAEHLVGVKLTVMSLLHHCPEVSVLVSSPGASSEFRAWIETLPNAKFLDDSALSGLGWNIKPTLLLRCLEEGHSEVVWVDADIIINGDLQSRFSKFDEETFVIAEEYYWGPQQGGTHRAVIWGLKPGRNLAASANTGVIRVTPHHTELLKAWKFLLNHPAYIAAQRQPAGDRSLAMISDQEVLTALLGSENFSHISVDMLKRGVDIAQCFGAAGYTPAERVQALFHAPPIFIHAIGGKPWMRSHYLALASGSSFLERLRAAYEYLYLELSPYVATSRQYQDRIGEEASWMDVHSFPGHLLRTAFLGNPALQGLPMALVEAIARRLRHVTGGDRYRFKSNFCLESSPFDS